MFEDAMVAHPTVAFANLNSKSDSTQIMFYESIASTMQAPPYHLTASEFENEVNKILMRYNKQPNYVSFLVRGAIQKNQQQRGEAG